MTNNEEYYRQSRPEMLAFVPPDTRRLLDIGCSEGRFGAAVKAMIPECETWGVEPMQAAAAQAATRNDRILSAPLEQLGDLPTGYFDLVTMNDVLEHLTYSEPALAIARRVLRPGGRLLLSLPNVRYFLNVRDLVFKKNWRYQDFGILDRTHMRFFTQRSAVELVTKNGFAVEKVVGINPSPLRFHYRALFASAPSFFADMRYPQFALVAQPRS